MNPRFLFSTGEPESNKGGDVATQDTGQPGMGVLPLPDLNVIAEMQMGVLTRLSDIVREKGEGKPVVWCSMLIEKEILFAMGVPAMYMEIMGAWASMFGTSGKYCQIIEESGLSRDVCAFHRCALGLVCAENNRDAFYDGLYASPDLLILSNFPCLSEGKSFQLVAEQYGCPYHFVDAPINTWGAEGIPDYAVDYYVGQLRSMIAFLEEHGYRMDWDRLKEEVAFTRDLAVLLNEIEVYKRAVPAPLKAFDSFIAATAPLAMNPATRKLDLWESLRDELKERVERGIGAVDDEKVRLIWVGVPPICDFNLLRYTERHGAVVAKTMVEFLAGFTSSPELLDPDKPLESMARARLSSPANPMYQTTIDYLVNATREYKIDGAVSVVKRTCGLIPGMQRLAKEALMKETGVPSIVFELDGVDDREYDEAAAKASLDSFVENLIARKGA